MGFSEGSRHRHLYRCLGWRAIRLGHQGGYEAVDEREQGEAGVTQQGGVEGCWVGTQTQT